MIPRAGCGVVADGAAAARLLARGTSVCDVLSKLAQVWSPGDIYYSVGTKLASIIVVHWHLKYARYVCANYSHAAAIAQERSQVCRPGSPPPRGSVADCSTTNKKMTSEGSKDACVHHVCTLTLVMAGVPEDDGWALCIHSPRMVDQPCWLEFSLGRAYVCPSWRLAWLLCPPTETQTDD